MVIQEIPAYMNYRNWNNCPSPAEHVKFMKHWEAKYGVSIVSLLYDKMECVVENPPKTVSECVELAKEQYIYCPDISGRDAKSLIGLAMDLYKSNYWYFWWD